MPPGVRYGYAGGGARGTTGSQKARGGRVRVGGREPEAQWLSSARVKRRRQATVPCHGPPGARVDAVPGHSGRPAGLRAVPLQAPGRVPCCRPPPHPRRKRPEGGGRDVRGGCRYADHVV
ncbi:hypothetical protein GCM10023082_38370 [Streptomyces tremellae]|uniref:Uncharacterized protein n=1 Tax=Streptomyces tremellae TaxID=1124239 RepID=A0ABP7FDZ8_9ACTN